MRTFLVTGAAGFIGYHMSRLLLERGDTVIGYDSVNDYYDVSLKESRLSLLDVYPRFLFVKADIEDREKLESVVRSHRFDAIIHLAAQAGVRYSLQCPEAYISSNLVGFFNILEVCRIHTIPHLLYASSSSVYGGNKQLPFTLGDKTDAPLSLYAATKKSNELLAHAYAHMFKLRSTGLRFFTVYGPYGRPDMALFLFTKRILSGVPIEVYNHGDMQRDFTYIDDITGGIAALIDRSQVFQMENNPATVYNLGNSAPVRLLDAITLLEKTLGKTAEKEFLPMQTGDVIATYADVSALERDTGFKPRVSLEEGIRHFVKWFKTYYHILE